MDVFSGTEQELYKYLLGAYQDYMHAKSNQEKRVLSENMHLIKSSFLRRGLTGEEILEVDQSAMTNSGYIDYLSGEFQSGKW